MINIHVVLSHFSYPYYEYMFENYSRTSTEHELKFYTYCLDDSCFEKVLKTSTPTRIPTGTGTTAHCNGVKSALNNFKNTKGSVDLIADTDTVMLVKGWDKIISNILEEVGAFGSTYERFGGYSSGSGPIQTYKDKPNLTWFATSKRYDFSRMDTSPDKTNHLLIKNEDMSKLYNLPVGFHLLRDTGWQIPAYLRDNGIPYKILDQEKPTDGAKIVRTGDNYHEEYQLEGVPFMAHQRGSLSKSFRSHDLSKKFYDTVDAYFATLRST